MHKTVYFHEAQREKLNVKKKLQGMEGKKVTLATKIHEKVEKYA